MERHLRALVLAFFAAAFLLKYWVGTRKDASRRLECYQLRIGMPESELLKRMGPPSEKLPGDTLTSFIYGTRTWDEKSIDTIAFDTRAGKIARIDCGETPVWQYYTDADALDAAEQREGESVEGQQRLIDASKGLRASNKAKEGWQRKSGSFLNQPVNASQLYPFFSDGFFPELKLPHHEPTRFIEMYGDEACDFRQDTAHVVPSALKDTGQWGYISGGACAGLIFIDCTHWAARGRHWYDLR